MTSSVERYSSSQEACLGSFTSEPGYSSHASPLSESPLWDMQHTKHAFKPLSQSPLWAMQRNYFEQQGIEAWRQRTVPNYITSNPFMAMTYVQMIMAYIEDLYPVQAQEQAGLYPETPLYIVELGAGAGKLAFHFLTQFLETYEALGEVKPHICYVMTDISHKNIAFWQQHKQFQPFVEKGLLDFARFDACADQHIRLQHSGQCIDANTSVEPMVFIANYVFDSIPMDLFELNQGQLHECLVQTTTDTGQAPDTIAEVQLHYQSRSCDTRYYNNPRWNNILEDYWENHEEGAFLFPTGALQCLRNLEALSGGRFLLLSADKGQHLREKTLYPDRPKLVKHGSFSLNVNYHALAHHAKASGAKVLASPHAYHDINLLAFLFDAQKRPFRHMQRSYQQHVAAFGPDDFHTLKKALEANMESLTQDQLLALLKLGRWDTKLFRATYETWAEHLDNNEQKEDHPLKDLAEAISRHHYRGAGSADSLDFELGTLLAMAGFYQEALRYLHRALQNIGHTANIHFNVGLTHWHLGNTKKARHHLSQALALDNDYPDAKALLAEINGYNNREGLQEPPGSNAEGAPHHSDPVRPGRMALPLHVDKIKETNR